MKNRKYLWTIAMAVLLGSVILAACGAPDAPTPVSPTPSASEHMALGIEYAEQGRLMARAGEETDRRTTPGMTLPLARLGGGFAFGTGK